MSTISASTTTTTALVYTADTTGTLVLQTGATPTTAVTIDGSQNVGVGTSSPSEKLHVENGNARINRASNSSILTLGGSPSANWEGDIQFLTSNNQINWRVSSNRSVSGAFTITPSTTTGGSTFTTPAVTIDASGNFLVGVTSAVAAPAAGLVVGTGNSGTLNVGHTSTGSGTTYATFAYNSGAIGSITQNGTTGVLYNLTSDYRLKNNQEALTGAKDFIMALKPKKWQWWDGSGEGVGFVAHEFMEVAKYSGHGEKDAVETIEIKDEDGNVTGTEERPVYQSIQPSSSEVMANLVSLIQEQQALITQLQADVAALKGAA